MQLLCLRAKQNLERVSENSMSQPENTFIASVHKHLPASLYRMKNHNQYNGGIADVWYSGSKRDLWIEYKFVAVPVRDDTEIDLVTGKAPSISYLQQKWLRERHAEGRDIAVIVGSKAGGIWLPGVSWDGTYTAGGFRGHIKTRNELAGFIQNWVL